MDFFANERNGDGLYRIYFVDDEPHILEGLINNPVFMEHGFIVVGFADDPLKAEEEIISMSPPPDIIFTDLKMSTCTGIELMEKLKQLGVTCEFVILSAFGEFAASRKFFTLGGFDYLTKPISDDELHASLTKLSRHIAKKKSEPLTVIKETPSLSLNKIMEYLKQNLAVKHTLQTLSTIFDLHPSWICELFSIHLNTTFSAYLTRLRMEAAAEMLKNTRKTVKEIAWTCGYDYLYFVQVFKKYYACTPTAFREDM